MTDVRSVGWTLVVALALGIPSQGQSQQSRVASIWVGGVSGDPTAGHAAIGIGSELPLNNRIGILGELTYLTETPSACEQGWPESYRCSFHGTLVSVGPQLTALQLGSSSLSVSIGGGLFIHGDRIFRTAEWSASLGALLAFQVAERIRLESRFRWAQIDDENVEGLLGKEPELRAILAGVGISF
jgi:hypothetical protein